MAAETEWRWADPQGQQRLVRTDELRAALANGVIPPNAPVWRAGFTEWKPAHDVPELTTSALAAVNGVVPNIPPPPLFVVAAQSAFEGPADAAGQAKNKGAAVEPPPPPRYVPAPTRPVPAPPPSRPSTSPTPPPAVSKPPPSTRGPISQRFSATESLKRSVPAVPPRIQTGKPATSPLFPAASDTQRDVSGAAKREPAAAPPAAVTPKALPTMVGVPRIEAPQSPSNPPRPHTTPSPPTNLNQSPPGRSTLLFDGAAPSGTLPPRASSAPPIVAPGAGLVEKNAVTRPPPVDMGTVRIGDPAPPGARPQFDSVEEISGSMLIEQGEGGALKVDVPPKSLKPSKPPPPGLRALAASDPRISRPPLPSASGQDGGASSSQSQSVSRSVNPTPPMPLGKPAPSPAELEATVAAPPPPGKQLSPPTLLGMGPIPSPGPPPADLLAQVDQAERKRVASSPGLRASAGADVEGEAIARDDVPAAPTPPWLDQLLTKFPQLRPYQKGRPVFFLPVVGGLGALVGLIMFGLLVRGCVSLFSSDKDTKKARRSETTEPASSSERTPEPTAPATAKPDEPASTAPAFVCKTTGVARVLAPKALVASGVEAVALPRGIGLGVATSPKEGIALELDPASLNVTNTVRAKGNEIRRVTPIVDRGRLFAAADVDKKNDVLVGGRTVSAPTNFEIGMRGRELAWAPRGGGATTLWSLDGDAPVEAIRVAPDGAGWQIAFRRGSSIFIGALSNAMKPSGSLLETRGLGSQVGSPTIATSNGGVLVMWADRAAAEQPWALRMRVQRAGGAFDDPKAFAPPGGPGGPVIAPSAVGIGGGRYFVVWTEGTGQNHQVRGATVNATGAIEGATIPISPNGTNAGQPQAVLLPDGRGAVAYLASSAQGGFELVAAAISCAP